MVDVYTYITSKQREGYRITSGSCMSFHGSNEDCKSYGENKKIFVVNEPDDADDKIK